MPALENPFLENYNTGAYFVFRMNIMQTEKFFFEEKALLV